MKLVDAAVISNEPAYPGVNLLWLSSPALAQDAHPGQFLMLRTTDSIDPFLRRALSIHRIGEGAIGILYGGSGAGTEYLRRKQPGDTVNVLGPLGQGFTMHPNTRNLLLLGTGWGLGSLVALAEQAVARDCAVTLLAGAPTAAQVLPGALVPAQAEVVVATEDGTLGHKGQVTDLAERYWQWADEVYACGPMAMYQTLRDKTRTLFPRKDVQVLAEMPMACGVGACFGCTVETSRGPVIACREGPKVMLHHLCP